MNCPICNGKCFPIRHGFYWRNAVEDDGEELRLRIQRYLCKTAKKTFSLLPERLVPYRAPCIKLLVEFWRLILFFVGSQQERLNAIGSRFPDSKKIQNLEYSHVREYLRILSVAMNRMNIVANQSFSRVEEFFEYCEAYAFNERCGWLAIAQWFFCTHKRFLFGTASQER